VTGDAPLNFTSTLTVVAHNTYSESDTLAASCSSCVFSSMSTDLYDLSISGPAFSPTNLGGTSVALTGNNSQLSYGAVFLEGYSTNLTATVTDHTSGAVIIQGTCSTLTILAQLADTGAAFECKLTSTSGSASTGHTQSLIFSGAASAPVQLQALTNSTFNSFQLSSWYATLAPPNTNSSNNYAQLGYTPNITNAILGSRPIRLSDAVNTIVSGGYSVGQVTTQSSSTVPAGYAISQKPAANAQVPTGWAVDLTISSGPSGGPTTTMPNFGFGSTTESQGASSLSGLGLPLGDVVVLPTSSGAAAQTIVGQIPAAGTSLAAGTGVALIVSNGPTDGLAQDYYYFGTNTSSVNYTLYQSGASFAEGFFSGEEYDPTESTYQNFYLQNAASAYGQLPGSFPASPNTSQPVAFELNFTDALTPLSCVYLGCFEASAGTGTFSVIDLSAPGCTLASNWTGPSPPCPLNGQLTVLTSGKLSGGLIDASGPNGTVADFGSAVCSSAGSADAPGCFNPSTFASGTLTPVNDAVTSAFFLFYYTPMSSSANGTTTLTPLAPQAYVSVTGTTVLGSAAPFGAPATCPVAQPLSAALCTFPVTLSLSAASQLTAIASLQSTTAGTPLTLNSSFLDTSGLQLSLTSTGNLSADTFTIVGKDPGGNLVTTTIAGPDADTVQTTQLFSSITSITPSLTDTNPADQVGAGLAYLNSFGIDWTATISQTNPLTGPSQVTVPNVVGDSQAAASSALVAVNLSVGTTTQQASSTVPVGDVISQTPAAGASVSPKTSVALVLSSGPAGVEVPNVVGQTQPTAADTLAMIGLSVGTVTQQASPASCSVGCTVRTPVPIGEVSSQSPIAGSLAPYQSAVNLVVSTGPLRGDLNLDGEIDKLDLALITNALNTPASGPSDPRDLNHDGVINVLDARILATLCTHAGCVHE
jgi:beta-lactam-binding protein with PASTA domain